MSGGISLQVDIAPLLALVRDKEATEQRASQAVQDALGELIARIDEPPLTGARETDANMTRRAAEGLKPEILQSELRGRDPTRVRHEGRSCRCARQKKSAHSAPDFFTRSRAVAITAEIYAANLARFRPAPSAPR